MRIAYISPKRGKIESLPLKIWIGILSKISENHSTFTRSLMYYSRSASEFCWSEASPKCLLISSVKRQKFEKSFEVIIFSVLAPASSPSFSEPESED